VDNSTLKDDELIDVGPRKRRRWRLWLIAAIILLLILLSRGTSIFLWSSWFDSLGFASVYWYILKLKVILFITFALATVLILRVAFWLLEKAFATQALEQRTIILNNQPVKIDPGRFVRPLGWVIAVLFGLFYGLALKSDWRLFALFLNKVPATAIDPIFQKPLSFYLFTLPIYDLLSSWLIVLTFIILCTAIGYSLLAVPQSVLKTPAKRDYRRSFSAVSVALAAFP